MITAHEEKLDDSEGNSGSSGSGVGRVAYVVRNAALLPVIFAAVMTNLRLSTYTDSEEVVPRFLLSSLVSLLSLSSNLSRSLPSTALLDQLLSLIPLLRTPEASASSVQLITMIGGRVMTVAHLKRIFRILSHNVSQNGVEESAGSRPTSMGIRANLDRQDFRISS